MSLLENVVHSVADQSGLSAKTFDELRAFIYDQTGIYFRDNKRYLLESQVGRRLKKLGLSSYEKYIELVQNGRRHTELPALVNAITINETFFFRHPKQYEAIAEVLLPQLIEQRSDRQPIRLWSAACSTGDEPYTLALLIKEKVQQRFPNTRFEILGTDINTEVLETAKEGVYGSYAVRNVPSAYLRKYFTAQADDRYVLSPTLREMVRFTHLNLTDRHTIHRFRNFDIILCANVLIYFDDETKQSVISNLYNSLRPGGYLFVGTSETLHGVTRAFQPVRFNDTIAYKKDDRHDQER